LADWVWTSTATDLLASGKRGVSRALKARLGAGDVLGAIAAVGAAKAAGGDSGTAPEDPADGVASTLAGDDEDLRSG
jgi:hypothetical protein